jgi:hypothetical protein
MKIYSTCHRQGGNQQMVVQKDNEAVLIPLELAGCIVHFKLRNPNPDEI